MNGRTYLYHSINIQPKNCDGLCQELDYLPPKLIEQFRNLVSKKSNRYATAVELNKDEQNHHFHSAFKLRVKDSCENIRKECFNVLESVYDISDNGYKYAVVVNHHTKKTFENTACGYLTKQFSSLDNMNDNYQSVGFPDYEIKQFKQRYEEEVKQFEENKKCVNTCRNHILLYKDINEYFKQLKIILDKKDELKNINSSNFEKYYIVILQEYKIGYQFNSIKQFHRNFLFFLTSINNLSETDTETLVDFLRFKKTVTNESSYIPNVGYVSTSIADYWSIN